ncbi:MAG: S41 family peptidase [Dehalococcoidia bacterium]|nr:S41 family peptidase [Dehalococcoidia bacterium]
MSKALRPILVSLLVIALVGLSFGLGIAVERQAGDDSGAAVSTPEDAPDFDALYEIYGLLRRHYVDQDILDNQTLYEAAINGMLKVLSDSGTYYVDPTTYNINVMPSGTFEGIGATVAEQQGKIIIVAPIADTPAQRAGIRSGDAILEVDGESTEGWTVEKAVMRIRGPRGTTVRLKVEHSDGVIEDLELTRDEIKIESVSREPPAGVFRDANGNEVTDLAYVHIREFTSLTQSQLEPILQEISDGGYKGLILDLRSNPGGLLEATVDVADMFLDGGIILVQVEQEEEEKVFEAEPGGPATKIPMVVLVNRFSASGAEVLAAALQDNGRAPLLGEKTFGKGTVNIPQELSDDRGALFVTVARWLTPDRILIDGVGIRPDIEVTLSDEDIDMRRDGQLLAAIEYLRGE